MANYADDMKRLAALEQDIKDGWSRSDEVRWAISELRQRLVLEAQAEHMAKAMNKLGFPFPGAL